MPEGPEIRRAADRLAKAIGREALRNVEFHLPALAPRARDLLGQRILAISPRGKALLTRFEGGLSLYTHNQLYGVWAVAEAGTRPETTRRLRVVLEGSRKALLLYSASDIALLDDRGVAAHPFLSRLGPDVLDASTGEEDVLSRLDDHRFRRRRLGSLLLDQTFLGGLGNYLRSEILFDAGLRPERRPMDLDGAERRRLASAILALPRLSYRTRGRPRSSHGPGPAFRFAVFDREGEPCIACGGAIERETVAGRRFYACPRCQA